MSHRESRDGSEPLTTDSPLPTPTHSGATPSQKDYWDKLTPSPGDFAPPSQLAYGGDASFQHSGFYNPTAAAWNILKPADFTKSNITNKNVPEVAFPDFEHGQVSSRTTQMDPFEVRLRFTQQLQHLNASVTSANKAAQFAIKYRDMDEDLHSCIIEQLERVDEPTVVCLSPP
jgi:hypothetical protein